MAIIGLSGRKQNGKDTVARIIQYLTKDKSNNLEIEQFINPHYAVDSYGSVKWKRKIFAGKLKEVVALLIGCTVKDLENEEFKNRPLGLEWIRYKAYYYDAIIDRRIYEPTAFHSEGEAKSVYRNAHGVDKIELTPRLILQELGTEGMRNIHPDFHVNALFADYKPLSSSRLFIGDKDNNLQPITDTQYEYPNWIIADVRFPNEVDAIRKRQGLVFRICNPRITDNDNHPSETSLDNYLDWDEIIDNNGSIEDLVNKVKTILIKYKII